jgi:hypothetical protein
VIALILLARRGFISHRPTALKEDVMVGTTTSTRYSIAYDGDPGESTAVEWNWLQPKKWVVASRTYGDVSWSEVGALTSAARNAIVRHFGLEKLTSGFQQREISELSPAELISLRRGLEREFGLPVLHPKSQLLGDHVEPESVAA